MTGPATPASLLGLASLMEPLRGFVAVGRRMSITVAANELCISQSALSRQILSLEERMGVKLLVRGHRSIAFTPEGEQLFRQANDALQQLQTAVGIIGTAGRRLPVTISASVGVAGLWLLPRLGRFQQAHSEIDVRVAAGNRMLDLVGEGVDLAIRYSPANSPPTLSTLLFRDAVAPVANATLGVTGIHVPDDLARHVLLEFDDPGRPWLHWQTWLAAAGWGDVKPKAMLRFNMYDQLVQAASAGHGIALGRLELIQPWIQERRLDLLPTSLKCPPSTHAYWLLQADSKPRPEVEALIKWITAEASVNPGVALLQ